MDEHLRKLGYNSLWLQYGLIDEAFLQTQSEQYETSQDKNTEHYRFAAFRAFLGNLAVLDDTLLAAYIRLVQLDDDRAMAQAAFSLLIGWPYLTDSQLHSLRERPDFSSPVLQRHIERSSLLRQLRSSPVTNELFTACIIIRDQTVQRELLERSNLSRQQLETLQADGANRAIRNIAKQELQRHL